MPQQIVSLLPLLVLLVLMYFMMIRPQQQQAKKRQQMLGGLKAGDEIITIGGLHGVIQAIEENTVRLKVASNLELTFNKSAVGTVKSGN